MNLRVDNVLLLLIVFGLGFTSTDLNVRQGIIFHALSPHVRRVDGRHLDGGYLLRVPAF